MRSPQRLAATALLVLAAPGLAVAQRGLEPFAEGAFPDRTERVPALTLPPLAFSLVSDVAVPGPLDGAPLRLDGQDRVAIPLESGDLVLVTAAGGGPLQVIANEDPDKVETAGAEAVSEPGSRRRFRVGAGGMLIAEKCRRSPKRPCRRIWKLRIPGGATVPPLVSPGRVYVGALDNQVYALRPRNGHRIWTVDVGRRVSNPLALWEGELPLVRRDRSLTEPRSVRLVLVMPEGGNRLLALDARSGRKVAIFELPEGEGRLVGSPLPLPGGTIAVARQRYAEREASLIVLAVEFQPPVTPPAAESASAPGPP